MAEHVAQLIASNKARTSVLSYKELSLANNYLNLEKNPKFYLEPGQYFEALWKPELKTHSSCVQSPVPRNWDDKYMLFKANTFIVIYNTAIENLDI